MQQQMSTKYNIKYGFYCRTEPNKQHFTIFTCYPLYTGPLQHSPLQQSQCSKTKFHHEKLYHTMERDTRTAELSTHYYLRNG